MQASGGPASFRRFRLWKLKRSLLGPEVGRTLASLPCARGEKDWGREALLMSQIYTYTMIIISLSLSLSLYVYIYIYIHTYIYIYT